MDPYRSSIEVYNQMSTQWNLRRSFPVNIVADAAVINDKVYVFAGGLVQTLLQQSLRRRPERLRGRCLRLVPQGRQCLRGYAPRSGGSGGWFGDERRLRVRQLVRIRLR